MKKLADQFVSLNADGTPKTYGLAMQNWNLQAITGVQLVDYSPATGYKLNLKDPKIAKLMNWYHSMGKAGSNAFYINDPIGDFTSGKTPMLITVSNPYVDARWSKIRNDVTFLPMPKLDASSPYYLEMGLDPGIAIPQGAKNVQAAALAIEYRRWLYLGRSQVTDYLEPKMNAARKKYKLAVPSAYDYLTDAEKKWTKEILAKYKYSYGDIGWGSWVNTNGQWSHWPGVVQVIIEGKAWSAVVEQEYPKLNSLLKAMAG